MKKFIMTLMSLVLVTTLFGCGAPPKNDIIFNQVSEYDQSGQRLVSPSVVTREVFCSHYKIDTSSLPTSAIYVLYYRYDSESGTVDETELVDGRISVYDRESETGFHIFISEKTFVPKYFFEVDNLALSTIEEKEVELYHLKDLHNVMKEEIYVQMEIEGYKVSLSFSGLGESEVVETIQDLIKSN